MRFAIFGDIHGNLEALQSVLADAEMNQCTHFVCLGDIVGYNANPHECLEVIRGMEIPVVKGNHDEQASGDDDLNYFNPLAATAIDWTRKQLTADQKDWLRNLRYVRQVRDFTIVHATLDTPEKWGYVFNPLDATASINYQHTGLCLCGHTHIPMAYVREGRVRELPFSKIHIERGKKYFINVGSVGQPRDGDWRSSYGIYDSNEQSVELRRIEYDIFTAQDKIVEIGLPQRLADRLALGK